MSEEVNHDSKKDTFQTGSVSEPGKGLVFAMACAYRIVVANTYYNQPMLAWKVAGWQGVAISAIAVALTASLTPLLFQHNHS